MQRVLIAATGTGVGKTYLTLRLARALRTRFGPGRVVALKPVETGAPFADARALESENAVPGPGPRYGFSDPVSPHLAARRSGVSIEIDEVVGWIKQREAVIAICDNTLPHTCAWSLIETAGGLFSPLAEGKRNFELLEALSPALWVLVAPDRLGVLHELDATLTALRHLGRVPDAVVLSASTSDQSTGTNAEELRWLGIASPVLALRHGEDDVGTLVSHLLERQRA